MSPYEYDERYDPPRDEEKARQTTKERRMGYDTQMDTEVREALEQIKEASKVIGRAAFAEDEDCTFDKKRLLKIATGIEGLLG